MPTITLTDLSLKDCQLTSRIQGMRTAYFDAVPEVCVERARLVTRYSAENGLFDRDRITVLEKARQYRFMLETRAPVVWHKTAYRPDMTSFAVDDRSLFAGSTTGKFKGVPLYPEFLALSLWPELGTITKRTRNPYRLHPDDARELNLDIFPRWMNRSITELTRARCYAIEGSRSAPGLKLVQRLVFFLASKPECISHTVPDFSRAVKEGLRAVINDARSRHEKATAPGPRDFYLALVEGLEGIVAHGRRLSEAAQALALNEVDADRRQDLLELARIHAKVPEGPAMTFREGLTTVWICWTAIHLENPNVGLSLGRLDQLLYGLLRQDLDAHRITVAEAVELVCNLWLKIGDHVPSIPDAGEQLFGGTGSNQAITVGGIDAEGHDAVNDLTYVMLRATELMRLRDPNLNARYCPGVNSDAYLERLAGVNIEVGATPAIHNDRAVLRALQARGDTLVQARDYAVVGCVEPGSNGRAYSHSGAIMMNLTSVLELTLYDGHHRHTGLNVRIGPSTGDPRGFATFAEFCDAFALQAAWLVTQAVDLNNLLGQIHQDYQPTPILSALFEGPMHSGKDLVDGGAVINASGAAVIALGDVADSLTAIRDLVYAKRPVLTMDGLLTALACNFVGHEDLQRRLMDPTRTAKYGNDDPAGDECVTWLVTLLDRLFGARENYRKGRYRVGYWSMTNHAGFGRLTGALPSGRRAGESFTSGITPVSGVTPSLIKALNSVAKLPAEVLTNGVALNIKFTPEPGATADAARHLASHVQGYFDDAKDGGAGLEIQFNVTRREDFIDAMDHPERHPQLLVRVSGYTAYFKDVNPDMQREIINRSEYLLSTGGERGFPPYLLPRVSDGGVP